MAAKKKLDPAQAKAQKQKKIVIVGGALLALIVLIEAPMMWKRMHPKSPAPTTADQTASAQAATPPPTDASGQPVSLAAPTLAGGNPTATAAPTGQLVSDPLPTAGQGQLTSFERFATKDPFQSQAPKTSATPGAPAPPKGDTSGGTPSDGGLAGIPAGSGTSSGSGTGSGSTPGAPAPSTVTISVNGEVTSGLAVGGVFPQSSAMFKLVAVGAHTVKVGINGGSYASGDATITLREKHPVTLQNTADGQKYTLVLNPSGAAASASTPTAPTTPVAPTSTTTPVAPTTP